MSACWMFMIFMGYRLSHAAQSQGTCTCKDHLKPVCVPAGGNVTVPCPNLDGEDMAFNLLKDQKVIYNHSKTQEKNASNSEAVELHENQVNNVSFRLIGVNASFHGIYRCEGIVMFPPPYITERNPLGILVLVEGHQCKHNKDCSDSRDQNSVFPWIWILVVLLIIIYSIIVTIIAFINWVKLRRTDSQSDYMNTKPRAPRDRKKKRGVQTPIPRHF
ncbi:T-cell-specific surface glycoprotein CD28 isoform X1 [Siniperca chuatsi]|uniref:T-cell-specific surface glycoprotein CD28 isoform X1 n=1 Tax=Siniperca chuatsi TaxID=119488 RepID=UPI001CE20E93|nr:T-cell-specific surface glycoprotein CD28 isoform X1 [Siniperca chuatsi]